MAANLKFILESISVGGSDNLVLYDPTGKLLAEWECILWEESEGFDAICHRYSFNNWPVGVIQLLQILSCPSCLPPLINIFGQVCPSDCHWSYRPRPRPVNWHWTDSGGETRRQLTSLTDFWHNFFRCQCPAHASNMYGENTIVLQFKSSKTEFIWNWQCEYCSKYHRDNRELWGSNESIKVQQFNPSYLVLRPP